MRKKDLNRFVFMEFKKSEQGFTLIHLLVAITILSISLPFLSYLLQAASSYNNNYSEISVQQFFQYLRNDVIESTNYQLNIHPPQINLYMEDGEIATLEPYEDLIRRKFKGGHEIYLRDVKQMQLKNLDYGFRLSITTAEGEKHEKSFVFYE